jgi:uncharacterized membrane protein YeaQ/YmgE (transglycosylase-associated protein family)
MTVSIIAWIVLGVFIGKLFNTPGDRLPLELLLGVLGALAGGWLYRQFGTAVNIGFDIRGLMVAGLGAMGILVAWHTFRFHTPSDTPRIK